jgi:hypothetical protein
MVFNATFNNISAILWWSGLGQMPPDKSPLDKCPLGQKLPEKIILTIIKESYIKNKLILSLKKIIVAKDKVSN